mmetsp:Transcript_16466/g.47320  ORF Transcript_16466/g.47320 Transcript_16466/m.47320 type:complete len:411 (-) Transcript_16466:24-1256(-)
MFGPSSFPPNQFAVAAVISLASTLPLISSFVSGTSAFLEVCPGISHHTCCSPFASYRPDLLRFSAARPPPGLESGSGAAALRRSFSALSSEKVFGGQGGGGDGGYLRDNIPSTSSNPFVPAGVRRISLPCRDSPSMEAMEHFYVGALGCSIVGNLSGQGSLTQTLAFGDDLIDLVLPGGDSEVATAGSGGGGSISFGLRVSGRKFDVDSAVLHFHEYGVDTIHSTASRGGLTVVDPEGNLVELTADAVESDVPATLSKTEALAEGTVEAKSFRDGKDVANDRREVEPLVGGDVDTSLRASADSTAAAEYRNAVDGAMPRPTPCVRICRYNSAFYNGQVCIGCFRDGHEIGAWSSMSPREKAWALMDAADRCPSSSSGEREGTNEKAEFRFDGAVSREELMRQAEGWEGGS